MISHALSLQSSLVKRSHFKQNANHSTISINFDTKLDFFPNEAWFYSKKIYSVTPDLKNSSPPAVKTTPKKESFGQTKRQKSTRTNSNIKSRAIVSTDSSSSDDNKHREEKSFKATLVIKETLQQTSIDKPLLLSPGKSRNSISPRTSSNFSKMIENSSEEENKGDKLKVCSLYIIRPGESK